MMKTEGKGDRTLRSASPHRNTYKTDFHAIKCSFDSVNTDNASNKSNPQQKLTNSSNGEGNDPHVRGRAVNYGNRVHKIKNMFMQMGGSSNSPCCENSSPSEPRIINKISSADLALPPPSSPPYLCVQKNNLLNSGSFCSSQDPLPAGSFTDKIICSKEEGNLDKAILAEKFSETRKLFERNIKKPSSLDRSTPIKNERIEDRRRHGSTSSDCSSVTDQFNFNTDVTSQVAVDKTENQENSDQKVQQSTGSCKSSSLNAGPISRRLESFLADVDNDDFKDSLKTKDIPNPLQTVFCSWESPVVRKEEYLQQNQPVADSSLLISSTSAEWSELSDSTEVTFQTDQISEREQQYKTSLCSKVDRAPIKISQVEVARAELIMVQNKTLGDNNEITGEVNILQKEKSLRFPNWKDEKNDWTFEETEDSNEDSAVNQKAARELVFVDKVQEQEQVHVKPVGDGEEEEQEQRKKFSEVSSSAFGIENAAFDDDREPELLDQGPEREETLQEEEYNYNSDYEELSGLSEEEDPDPARKVKFSTAPIKVKLHGRV
ncbi:hypothetical protein Chor_015885 [Crotalus horridus]